MSCTTTHIRLRYRVYVELRRVCGDDNLPFAVPLARPGLGISKLRLRCEARCGPHQQGGVVRSDHICPLWGGAERGVLAMLGWGPRVSFGNFSCLSVSGVGEDRACGAGIGGEPVEVFAGEGLA